MSQKCHSKSQEDVRICDLNSNLSRRACCLYAVVSYVRSFTKFQLMPAGLHKIRVGVFFQSRRPEMVSGVAALFWLWNQSAELHCLCEYPVMKWHHPPREMYGSLTVLTLKSSQIAHSWLYVWIPGLEWQTVNCFPPSSAWISHSPLGETPARRPGTHQHVVKQLIKYTPAALSAQGFQNHFDLRHGHYSFYTFSVLRY